MGWGEAVRDAQLVVHAWESCRDFAANLLRYVTWTVFLLLEDYSCTVGFFRGDGKDLGSKNSLLGGMEVPVRELLISSPACQKKYVLY